MFQDDFYDGVPALVVLGDILSCGNIYVTLFLAQLPHIFFSPPLLLPQVVEVYGLLALGMSLWNQLVLPVLFMCFWLLLFALQIYSYFSTRDKPTSRERLLFLFLTR